MNKSFFSLLLLTVFGVIGYKYYYTSDSSCHSCCGSHVEETYHKDSDTHSSPVTSLTTVEGLNALLSNEKPSLIKVYLDGCPPCKEAASVYPDIAMQFPHVAFYDLNVTNSDVMKALLEKNVIQNPITAAPTFLLIKNGKAVEILQGFNGKDAFIEQLTPLFNS